MKPLLIEIGSEEIPARFVPKGLELLKEDLTKFLDESSISYGSISEFATPRRLALLIDDVAEKQEDKTVESFGPSKKAAYDADGNPTKAAAGFAKSLGIDVSDLIIKETDKGEYVSATVEKKGKPTVDVLSEGLPKIISSLKLPKSMRWGDSSLRYFRPIQWILAILGKEVIPFELDGMKSGNVSYGHRFLSPHAINIEKPSSYLSLLKNNNVIANFIVRKEMISKGIKEIESSAGCKAIEDKELLETVTNLVEHPVPVLGNFEDKYLSLPKELLITVMRAHQKYFAMQDAESNMTSSFIVISNMNAAINDTVKRGAERVLRARLEDARFYFIEDQKNKLWDLIEELKNVTFQEKLGSVYDKTERISTLSAHIAGKLNPDLKEKAQRASMLCKADLVTGVVGEFPELQGYMGMTYASISGEEIDVASAIYEHYMPRFAGDSLPSGEIGTIVSLSDKLDNIASFFYLDMIPSGSEDPFALRRQAAGIIHILRTIDYPDSLNSLIDTSFKNLESDEDKRAVLAVKIVIFFRQRLEGILLSEGNSYDVIDAVLSTPELDLNSIKKNISILSELKKQDGFPTLLIAAKRVYNILKDRQDNEVDESLFVEDSEKELFAAANNVENELLAGYFDPLFKLEKPIDIFFEKVLVMDKDDQIKNNRLALLSCVRDLFNSLGDFSRIVE
ncbi:MAG: glycine--tRNA ligase subunit beta [Nitrospira sp.]|nr:glycine--tRNA ligase subunit beta [Nitrospira sp.]